MALLKTGVLALGVLFAPQLFDVYIYQITARSAAGRVFILWGGEGVYFLYCVPKWASLQDRLGCSAAAARFSLSLLDCSTLESFCRSTRVCEIKGDELEGGGWGGGAALALAGRHSGAIRGVSRALLCALSCRALRCLRVHHNTNTK